MTKVTRSTNPTTLLVIMMFIGCFALTKHASAQTIKGYTMTERCAPPPNHSFEAYHCRTTAFDIGPWVESRQWQMETVVRSCDDCWDEDTRTVISGEECFDEIVPL